jgi:hypothetical protein
MHTNAHCTYKHTSTHICTSLLGFVCHINHLTLQNRLQKCSDHSLLYLHLFHHDFILSWEIISPSRGSGLFWSFLWPIWAGPCDFAFDLFLCLHHSQANPWYKEKLSQLSSSQTNQAPDELAADSWPRMLERTEEKIRKPLQPLAHSN